ncbi:MAG TPA: DNA mismatch repair protein MutS, partial [Ruminococcus sp.]|nr:DNA mismatch repair protein MutS [Ruminococcus sp.]
MLEYFSIKKENSDKIVLFRIGDFYEAMGEDAIIVSKALDLNNTKRRINDNEHIDMCGIPANKLYSFTDTLVKNGYDVAIADIVDNKHQVVSNI